MSRAGAQEPTPMTDPSAYNAIRAARASLARQKQAEASGRATPASVTLPPIQFLNPDRPRPKVWDLDPDQPDLSVLLQDEVPF